LPVPNPEHLLEQATRLGKAPAAGRPRQVDLRRAISSAYYALFHFILASAADQIVGVTKRASREYSRVYRSIDHRSLRELCEEMQKATLPARFQPHAPRSGFGPNIAAFAAGFSDLQEKRHLADYDPLVREKLSDAQAAIRTARAAIVRFKRASAGRRKAFLSLLLFPPRR
jgi:hypothetical protein